MNTRNKTSFLFLFFIVGYLNSFAQQYNFKQYNVQDGLAHSQVSSILQDSKGYMWFSTYGGGLSKFDGKKFINYTEKEGLPNNIIRPMIEDNEGNLWLGTMGAGVCKFDASLPDGHEKKFSILKDSTTKINEKIYTIIQSKSGVIWFGADNGLYSYDGKHVKHYIEKDGFPEVPIMSIFEDSKGVVWVSVWEKGVYYFESKKEVKKETVKQITDKSGLSYHTLMCTNEDAEGNIWFSSFKGMTKLTRKKDGSFVFSTTFSEYIDKGLNYMMMDDGKGNLWFATTNNGMVKYNKAKNTYTKISSKNGLAGDIILTITKDREGNIWASTWGFGATMFQGERFIHYTQKEGFSNDVVAQVINDGNGGLIINASKGIYKYNEKDGIQLFDKQLENFGAYSIALDKKGVLWLGDANGLSSYSNGKLKKYTKEDGMSAVPVTSIMCENDNVWAASWSGGLSCFDGKKFKNYSAEDGLSSPYIYTLFKNNSGEICIGTWDGGLNIYDAHLPDGQGKKFKVYKKEQGLPNNNVISITQGPNNMWIGTFGGGVCEFDARLPDGQGKKFKTLSTKDGLSDDGVVGLTLDDNQNLIVATSKGLNFLNLKAFENTGKADFRFYGASEGFTGIECTHNSSIKDDKGNLWFGTKKGLTKYISENDSVNVKRPITYITEIKLFFEKTDWTKLTDSVDYLTGLPKNLVLSYTNNHLTFSFIGINTTAPENVRYKYMLVGADKDWSPATEKNEATYSGLPPGEYHFQVKACNNDGVWEERIVTAFDFIIEPPFWRRTWFYILCVFVLIISSFLYTKWQTKKLAKENKILEGKVVERTAKVEKQKDELHFAYTEIEHKNILVEQKNRDITDSINYAKRIQKAILPLDIEIQKSLPESFILFKPRDIVSGDFYWFARIDNKNILACVDCTGHGVPGAFMSMIGYSLLNEIVYEKKIYEPAKILNYLNDGVRLSLKQNQQDNETHDGMDIALISIDGLDLQYAGAHRPLYLIRNGSINEISANKFAIGGMQMGDDKKVFENNLFTLEKRDTLYMFTDGFVDQFGGEKGKKFMSKRFQGLLLSIQDKTLAEQKVILDDVIEKWKGNIEQVDDILVIGVRV